MPSVTNFSRGLKIEIMGVYYNDLLFSWDQFQFQAVLQALER